MNVYVYVTMIGMFVTGVCFYHLNRHFSLPRYLFYLTNFIIGITFGYLLALAFGLPFSELTLLVMIAGGWLGLQFAWVVSKYQL